MSMKWSNVLGSSFVILLLALGAMLDPTYAQGKDSAAPVFLGQTAGDFIIKDFHFNSGEVLPELRVHYVTLGTPHRNSKSEIDNAILFLHSTGSDATEFFEPDFSAPLYGPGQPLDLTKFYLIIPDAIGNGKSSKPSDGMRGHFPHYGYEDMVAAQHRLVSEKLGVTHLRLVMGLSMGGMHTWLWGERYPEMMDGLFPISALPVETGGRNRLWRHMIVEMIRNDPEWNGGDYHKQLECFVRLAPLVAIMNSNPARQYEKYPTRAAADAWYERLIQNARTHGEANNVLYHFDASSDYNPAADLEKIKAKLLLILFEDDQINSPEFAALDHAMPRVKNGRYVIIPAGKQSDGEGNNTDVKLWRSHLEDFLRSVTSGTAVNQSMNPTEASSPEAEVSAETVELTRRATEAGHAYARRELPILERLTADDYVLTDVRGGVLHRAEWLEFVKNRKTELTVESDDVHVSYYGSTAVVTGRWTYTLKETVDNATSYSRWTSVWTRYPDGWKRHASRIHTLTPTRIVAR